MSNLVYLASITALLPLVAFIVISVLSGLSVYKKHSVSTIITGGSTFVGFVLSAIILYHAPVTDTAIRSVFPVISAGSLNLTAGVFLDRLSATMLVVVTSVSLLVQIYSHAYMAKDQDFHRFFAYLNLFNFSMISLVLSINLFQTYVFWEMVGVSSYLLIGFWLARPSAANAAKKAFVMNRIGDFGLLAGILALLYFGKKIGLIAVASVLDFQTIGPFAVIIKSLAGNPIYILLCLALFLGAVAKSAQFPLHTWLPDAMEGPTPISALIHAATMVAAGVFLVARLYPVFEQSHTVMSIIAWTGAITMIISAFTALTQYDLKKVLAYSTCSQLGYMFMAMGAGAYSAGLFHLVTHSYFKALLFLCSGAIIHGLNNQQDMRYMGGLRQKMPVVAYTYLCGVLAISGLLFSGFWSKDSILAFLFSSKSYGLLLLGIIAAGMTSFYMFRSYFMTFEGSYSGTTRIHKPALFMSVPLLVLSVPTVVLGFFLSGKLLSAINFETFISRIPSLVEHESLVIVILSMAVDLVGLFLSTALYTNYFPSINEKLNSAKSYLAPVYNLSFNKLYFDELYDRIVAFPLQLMSVLLVFFDKFIVDGAVSLVAFSARIKGKILSLAHNGNTQNHLIIMFGGLVFVFVVVLTIWLI